MADPYVIFPGTAGSFIQTDDVNRVNADAAHLQQSLAGWVAFQSLTAPVQVVDGQAPFGTLVASVTATADGQGRTSSGQTGDSPASTVDPETEVSVSVSAKADREGITAIILVYWYNAGGGDIGNANDGTYHAIPVGSFGTITTTVTSPALAEFAQIRVYYEDMLTGDEIRFAAICLRDGAVPGFVPSLRIVGTLYEETVPADMPVVFAGDGTPLTVGEGWAGNGYTYNRYDGADASAPLVASFQAGDVPVPAQLPS